MDNITITKQSNRIDFEGVYWVSRARKHPSGNNRYDKIMKVVDRQCVCTNGHRLHAYTLQDIDIPNGTYEVISATKSVVVLQLNNDLWFPDVSFIIPHASDLHYAAKIDVYQYNKQKPERFWQNCRVLLGFIIDNNDNTINMDYVRDAVSCVGVESMTAYVREDKPCCFKGKHTLALVMPIKM